jgi:8-amino-7-oxononanoate synthase
MPAPRHIRRKLEERQHQHAFRSLQVLPKDQTDFASNDYLGLARVSGLHLQAENIVSSLDHPLHAGTGSRLISGNHPIFELAENRIAEIHHSESALLFPSGYTANLGLISCMAERHDTIIYDEWVHASIRDGIKLSNARSLSFQHNDLIDLEKKMLLSTGQIFIITESIFSMDGDEAPLQAIVDLAKKHQAHVILDEAHALGVLGWGLAHKTSLSNHLFARVVTFGKALGSHGAAVLVSSETRDYLINFSRPFIYSTAMPPNQVANILAAHEYLLLHEHLTEKLQQNIRIFKEQIGNLPFILSRSAIQCMLVPGNELAKLLANELSSNGFFVKAILHPTVPIRKERIRICLHSFNTVQEITELLTCISKWAEKFL